MVQWPGYSILILMFSIFLALGLDDKLVSGEINPGIAADEKIIDLNFIFGNKIVFEPACPANQFTSVGFQTVGSGNREDKYFNFERIYSSRGNDINVKFHFWEGEKRLNQLVWEKYLMHYSLSPSEYMFFEVNVNYYGEEYVNARMLNKISTFKYEVYSDVEMDRIHYSVSPTESCMGIYRVIEVDCQFNGLIYNAAGNRAIRLDGVPFSFQVLAVDTSLIMPKPETESITFTHVEGQRMSLPDTLRSFSDAIAGSVQAEDFGFPSVRWKGKPFMLLDRHRMIFRLPEDSFEKALTIRGTRYFNPKATEKPLEHWIQVPYNAREYWRQFAEEAGAFVKQ